jgi:uncharacterized protein YbbK (DUF523 family)
MSDLHARFQRLHDPDPAVALAEAEGVRDEATAAGKRVVAVSACLLGYGVRPDGGHKHAPRAVAPLLDDPDVIVLPVCPEILARMGVPRPTVQFVEGDGRSLLAGHGRIEDAQGRDRTEAMLAGARVAERICAVAGASAALLKEKSPSCGVAVIHGPGGLQEGSGVFAALLDVPLSTEV